MIKNRIGILLTLLSMVFLSSHAANEEKSAPPKIATASGYFLPGDLDGNGEITISDVTLAIAMMTGGGDPSLLEIADINKDGIVTIADVTSIVQMMIDGVKQIPININPQI